MLLEDSSLSAMSCRGGREGGRERERERERERKLLPIDSYY